MNKEIKIEVAELIAMMRNYWSTTNNELCTTATILFLRSCGFKDVFIRQFLELDSIKKFDNEYLKSIAENVNDEREYKQWEVKEE